MAGRTGITGDQVEDESLTGDDVEDGTMLKADLSVAVQSEINANTAKISDINHVQIELPNADNTSDLDKPVSTAQAIANTADRARANHTGTQLSSTISNFASTVRSTVLTGISFASGALVTASDSILVAIGKLQAQLNAAVFGRDYKSQTKEVSESTSGTTPDEYDSMTFPVTDTATNEFRINIEFFWGHNSASNDIRVFLLIDGSIETEIRIEPKDQGTDQRIQNNILAYANNLSIGNHTASIEYRPASGSRTSRMYRSLIEVWRVA